MCLGTQFCGYKARYKCFNYYYVVSENLELLTTSSSACVSVCNYSDRACHILKDLVWQLVLSSDSLVLPGNWCLSELLPVFIWCLAAMLHCTSDHLSRHARSSSGFKPAAGIFTSVIAYCLHLCYIFSIRNIPHIFSTLLWCNQCLQLLLLCNIN